MRCLKVGCLGVLLLLSLNLGAQPQATQKPASSPITEDELNPLTEPLYSPFIERYILDELKQLRMELAAQKVEMTEKILDRDLMVSDKAMSYATSTVTYFFYLIAAVSSILVIVGWTSIRDIRDKVHSVADKEVQKLVEAYEKRLHAIEKQLMQKARHIDENRQQIERTQEVHSLWLRAAQEHSVQGKIAIYDEILKLRPSDAEALTYKADMVLELGEPQWAKNLCVRAVEIDPQYGYAHYQLACANVALNDFDEAVAGLTRAIQCSDAIMEDIRSDHALAPLREYPAFKALFENPVVVRKPGVS
jgi:hypothetical protein